MKPYTQARKDLKLLVSFTKGLQALEAAVAEAESIQEHAEQQNKALKAENVELRAANARLQEAISKGEARLSTLNHALGELEAKAAAAVRTIGAIGE
jgi:chromosome segregation ATPase